MVTMAAFSLKEQRVIVKFLHLSGNSPIEIHRKMSDVCPEGLMDVKNVRSCVRKFSEGDGDSKLSDASIRLSEVSCSNPGTSRGSLRDPLGNALYARDLWSGPPVPNEVTIEELKLEPIIDEDGKDSGMGNCNQSQCSPIQYEVTAGKVKLEADIDGDEIDPKMADYSRSLKMPKKNSTLGRVTAKAKRARLAREKETSQERKIRLSQDRSRHASRRESETSIQRYIRLSLDNVRRTSQRERETSVKREARLSLDRARHLSRRQAGLAPQRSACLAREHPIARLLDGGASINEVQPTLIWVKMESSAMRYDANTASP